MTRHNRGLDLIDETANVWARRKYAGLKELLYARELFAAAVLHAESNDWLEKYFMQFAIAARLRDTL